MASLIDRIAQTSATLRVPTGEYYDGKPQRTGRAGAPGSPPRTPDTKKAPGSLAGTRGPGEKRFAPRCFPALLNAVSSPRGALTAVFGMGTGVTPPPEARTKGGRGTGTLSARFSLPEAVRRLSALRWPAMGLEPAPGVRLPGHRGRGRRPGLSADQKRYGQRLAALAHPPCRTGGLPVAFGGLAARDGSSPGGLGA